MFDLYERKEEMLRIYFLLFQMSLNTSEWQRKKKYKRDCQPISITSEVFFSFRLVHKTKLKKNKSKKSSMSSNYRTEETTLDLDFTNPAYNDEDDDTFTDLQSCRHEHDTDSRKNILLKKRFLYVIY